MFWEAGHLSCHHLWKGGTESGCESKGALGFRRESLSAHGIFSGCEFRLPDPHRSWFGVESSLRSGPRTTARTHPRGLWRREHDASLVISPRNKTRVLEMAECRVPCSSLAQFWIKVYSIY